MAFASLHCGNVPEAKEIDQRPSEGKPGDPLLLDRTSGCEGHDEGDSEMVDAKRIC